MVGQLHEQGKTDQAKADLARLAKIRAEREAAAAKRKAEAEGEFLLSLTERAILIQPTKFPSQSR